jgi:hypothetical protein
LVVGNIPPISAALNADRMIAAALPERGYVIMIAGEAMEVR